MSEERIKLQSEQFGELEIAQGNIFNFENGILGFEDQKRFILISEEKIAPFKWLISMDNPNIGLPIVSPWLVELAYELDDEIDLSKRVPMVVVNTKDKDGKMTANLKAPIFLDVNNLIGEQIIQKNNNYSTEAEVKEL